MALAEGSMSERMGPDCADFLSCAVEHEVFSRLFRVSEACEVRAHVLGGNGSSITHRHSVVAKEASEAATAVLQGEGLPVGGVGGGPPGVEAVVSSCREQEDSGRQAGAWGSALALRPVFTSCGLNIPCHPSQGGQPRSPAFKGPWDWPALASDLQTLGSPRAVISLWAGRTDPSPSPRPQQVNGHTVSADK